MQSIGLRIGFYMKEALEFRPKDLSLVEFLVSPGHSCMVVVPA